MRSSHRQPGSDAPIAARILATSGLLDETWYRAAAGLAPGISAPDHYLSSGARAGLEPRPGFDGKWLQPYFASAGLTDAPGLTFAVLQAAGWRVYPNPAAAESDAAIVRESALFDARGYAAKYATGALDPAVHYVLVGEQLGHAPSAGFDPGYYAKRNPDIAGSAFCLLTHFLRHGIRENRRPVPIASDLLFDTRGIDPARPTILLASHQASRTGAPILALNMAARLRDKYNVVGLLLAGGDLVTHFHSACHTVIGPVGYEHWHPVEFDRLIERIAKTYRIHYAIANSIDSRLVMKPLSLRFIPVVCLVHEFSEYLSPPGEMGRALEWATEIGFSAERVAASARSDYPNLANREIHILPQGPSRLPVSADPQTRKREADALLAAMRPPQAQRALVVLGCGTVYPRKGVDLFVDCAAAVAAKALRRPVRFVWIGPRLPQEQDPSYFTELKDKIDRLGIGHMMILVDEVSDLEPAYAAADVFFLSSRLDPLPNVTIDAGLRGLPVICFAGRSGMADLLAADPSTRAGIVPELDVAAAAAAIAALAEDEALRHELGSATRRLSEATFDMDRYVAQVDEVAARGAARMRQRAEDFETIKRDRMFDADSYVEPGVRMSRDQAIRHFLARAAALGIGNQPTANFYYRRPCPGFHPQIYAHAHADRFDLASINPLADYIRRGKRPGPWCHDVIRPPAAAPAAAGLRVAIHVHFFYPELYADFLAKIGVNVQGCDLFLTTTDEDKAAMLERGFAGYRRGKVVVRIVPNRGRDIGAMLTGAPDLVANGYDVVGHLHSKRSVFLQDPIAGDRWREFIWQNLLGGFFPMMDAVVSRFAREPELGLVFPDDPHLSDWDFNRESAERLARKIGIADALPPFFNFPVGTMFWARPAALAPLLDLDLQWQDYPEEPVPSDGTVLHAIERLLPFVARHAGYGFATTHVPGINW